MDKIYEYDVALSFAGENRMFVEKLANFLREKGIKVFYDGFEEVNLWGKNLYTHLSSIYKDKARFTVIFISKYYAQKLWTNHERENAQARAFKENKEYILPVRFDDTVIPGILDTVGYIDLKNYTPEKLGLLICKKLSISNEPANVIFSDKSGSKKTVYQSNNNVWNIFFVFVGLAVIVILLLIVFNHKIDTNTPIKNEIKIKEPDSSVSSEGTLKDTQLKKITIPKSVKSNNKDRPTTLEKNEVPSHVEAINRSSNSLNENIKVTYLRGKSYSLNNLTSGETNAYMLSGYYRYYPGPNPIADEYKSIYLTIICNGVETPAYIKLIHDPDRPYKVEEEIYIDAYYANQTSCKLQFAIKHDNQTGPEFNVSYTDYVIFENGINLRKE